MRNIIFLIAMAVEIFLVIYCLAKRSNRVPAGYVLAALSLAAVFVTGYLLCFPKFKAVEASGPYRVASINAWYTDPNRLESYSGDGSCRELPVAFWYPEDMAEGAKCPLVVFSHGSLGVKESNLTLYRELASRGFVVAAADHTYQSFQAVMSDGRKIGISGGFLKEIMTDNPRKNPEKSLERMRNWMSVRTGDLNFILDTILDKVSSQSRELEAYRLIDGNKIVAMGHSLGGSAALGIGRTRKDVSAVISLEAPFMCDMLGVRDGNFVFDDSPYPVRMLNVYSDSSWEHLREWKQYGQNAYYLDDSSGRYKNVHMSGLGHMSLTDFSQTSPFLTMCIDGRSAKSKPEDSLTELNRICIEFLKECNIMPETAGEVQLHGQDHDL